MPDVLQDEPKYGLVTCGGGMSVEACQKHFENQPTYVQVATAAICLAILACGCAFVWSCVVCFMCCCKGCLTPPLPILTGLATVLMIIGITVFGVKSEEKIDLKDGLELNSWDALNQQSDFGMSMWIGIASILVLALDTIIGIILVKTSKVVPI